ncbi:MAG: ribonuclease J [Clostridia bacterium]|nr:ribonuclease J [Clostridia bacterium]
MDFVISKTRSNSTKKVAVRRTASKENGSKLKIIPLGGLHEVGKNMTVFEYENDMIIVDAGLAFPEDEMLGVDLVIPDITYLKRNAEKIKGIVVTHGHEDHIGALPYVLKELNIPIYATKLTLGLIETKLEEHGLLRSAKMYCVKQGQRIRLGCFEVEFIRTNHSIPDSVALAINTPVGMIVHTGDFKVDYTPIDGGIIDLAKFGILGKKGVLALMSDSTNAERQGFTMSESTIGQVFEELFDTDQRILVATFASNIHRIQQVINAAEKTKRKVAICGRSMLNVITVAHKLGYIKFKANTLIDIDDIGKYSPHQICIITTGSQGEPMAALSRIANSEHKKVEIYPGDRVIISASPIPGNEKYVSKLVDELFKQGADVIYHSIAETHVSGHACQEELKLIQALVKPKFFIPVHGEYKHLRQHAKLAEKMGVEPENIFILSNGKVLEMDKNSAKVTGMVNAGRVLVDGLGVGDVGSVVLRDRQHLSQDGLIVVVLTLDSETGMVVAGPDVISRGFVYMKESEDLMEEIRELLKKQLQGFEESHITDWNTIKSGIKDSLKNFLFEKTKRKPMILPVVMEV